MTLPCPVQEEIPLQQSRDGVIVVANTRVTLDTVVACFRGGLTPEEIAERYDALTLADVYQAIGYYLRHSSELQPYFDQRQTLREQVQQQNEDRWPAEGLKARLLNRRSQSGD